MNDQHPHAGYVGYDSHSTGSFDNDPLFGSLPGSYDGTYDTAPGYAAPHDSGQAGYSGQYDSTQWDTGAHRTATYDQSAEYPAYASQPQQHPQYDAAAPYDTAAPYAATPQYDAAATWVPADGYGTNIPAQGGAPDSSGQWDTSGRHPNGQWAGTDPAGYDTGSYDTASYDTGSHDTGAYDATAWSTGATPEHGQQTAQTVTAPYEAEQATQHPYETQETYVHEKYEAYEAYETYETYAGPEQASYDPYEPYRTAEFSVPEPGLDADGPDAGAADRTTDHETAAHETAANETAADESAPQDQQDQDLIPAPADGHRPASRPVSRGGGSRSRRRSPSKRSALLTVAVPSACVMSVAGIAAASVGGMGGEETKDDTTTTAAAADTGSVEPVAANNKLDTQLANLSADAENFADRASRTQERIDLKEREAAAKKKREVEAARKEALRPKYVLPVKQHGLSAYFGQAGVNWMSVHTGIDFPVQYGTPVMAATDGTVRTQYNTAYGNMAIVTMADGTETWYCHLSSTRIRSGSVKAGDVIAYSGNSGNSTGPHMHFEVRPGGGAAVDPLPWLRSHDVDPT